MEAFFPSFLFGSFQKSLIVMSSISRVFLWRPFPSMKLWFSCSFWRISADSSGGVFFQRELDWPCLVSLVGTNGFS